MPIESIILILVSLINLSFVGVLSYRSTNARANVYFILAILFNVFWTIGDAIFYGVSGAPLALAGSKVFFIAPMFTAFFLLLFSRRFMNSTPMSKRNVLLLVMPLITLAVLIAADSYFLIDSIKFTTHNSFVVNTIPFYIYSLFFVVYFSLSYLSLYLNSKKQTGTRKTQVQYILVAAILSSSLALVSNLSLPIMGNTEYIWLGPIFTMFYIVIVSYAIVKHKLFDIRAAVSRAVAYLISIAILILLYTIAVYALSGANILSSNLTTGQRLAYLSIAILTAFILQPLKKFFDKLTNKLFYRDAYDIQNLIDDLNKNLVSGVELTELLTKSALIIQDNLKSSFVTFYIRPTSYFGERIIGARRNDPEFKGLDVIQETARNLDVKVYEPEFEPPNDNQKKLSEVLRSNDVEVLVRLVNSLEYHLNGIGYIFIGPKLSGNIYSKKDLRLLEIVANELVIAIENALRFEEIEEFNVTLQNKIDSATKELRKSNDKLTALDEAKDEFISMASHQLRTPLTSVKGYISMVLEGDAGKINPQQAKLLDQAFISSQRMVYLIADLLNVSRLRTGKFAIETHPTNLADVVEGEMSQLKGAAEARGLKLVYDKPKNFPILMLDETKIRQVIMNFIDNAIYYTPKGTITAYLKTTKTSVEFGVTDTGMGVPKKDVPQLFTKFYRGGNARKARPDGTGLGLFMAKKVIVASGGSILLKTKEGKGSTFGFIFPLEKLRVEEKSKKS